MTGVLIRSWRGGDPRFSAPQQKALEAAAAADPAARLLGLDFAMRPVVVARLGVPRQERTYAIQRNGDPTEPKLGESGGGTFLLEPWAEVPS